VVLQFIIWGGLNITPLVLKLKNGSLINNINFAGTESRNNSIFISIGDISEKNFLELIDLIKTESITQTITLISPFESEKTWVGYTRLMSYSYDCLEQVASLYVGMGVS
jgi:hypothetical protein